MENTLPLYVGLSPLSGRGVFCRQVIPAGHLIEVCPVIVLPRSDIAHIDQTRLHDYYFIWGENDQKAAIILGFGSLYNHSFQPNAEYRPDYQAGKLSFFALQEIAADIEITVNYNGTPSEQSALWFQPE
ncbi:MAG TPA: SET domain-containing protein [Saprospiraceae bacterium]|nr:SET domain-containing protein [Saprospiraceae bacterium]